MTDTPHPSTQENKILPTEEVFARNLNSKTAEALHSSKINSHTFNRQTAKLILNTAGCEIVLQNQESRNGEKRIAGGKLSRDIRFAIPVQAFTTPLVSCWLGFGFRSGEGGGVGEERAGIHKDMYSTRVCLGQQSSAYLRWHTKYPPVLKDPRFSPSYSSNSAFFATQIFWLKNLIVCIFNCFNLYFLSMEELRKPLIQ